MSVERASKLKGTEREESKFRMDFVSKLVEIRKQQGMSQKRLAEMSGLKQPAIARLECMQATPRIDTIFKLLRALGYALAVVPESSVSIVEYGRAAFDEDDLL